MGIGVCPGRSHRYVQGATYGDLEYADVLPSDNSRNQENSRCGYQLGR
jgi:hypothetical protein